MKKLLLALVLATLAGCECPPDYKAHVVDKRYVPAHMTLQPVYTTTYHGKTSTTHVTYIPVHVPDRYWLLIRKDEPDTSYTHWWGGKRDVPKLYHKQEELAVDVISYSQWQIASPITRTYRCNAEKR